MRLTARSVYVGIGVIIVGLLIFLGIRFGPGLVRSITATARTKPNALPSGFSETLVASRLNSPTALAVSPDGRIFITQQGGVIRIMKNDVLLPTPFYTVDTASFDEQGLVGLAFDPDFASNGYIYITYTPSKPVAHQRLSRLTAVGDVAAPGSEVMLFELDANTLEYHFGGALSFGADGKLYMTTGEGTGGDAPSLSSFGGKILRLNRDGSIPSDNPFYTTASGNYRAIWATGFRNAYTFAIQPGTNHMFINDVGGDQYEEINEGIVGANYGAPHSEGPTSQPGQTSPIYTYDHKQGCAIAGSMFYNPPIRQFPSQYIGKYFFMDYCGGWIR